jgi:hypothetical protein
MAMPNRDGSMSPPEAGVPILEAGRMQMGQQGLIGLVIFVGTVEWLRLSTFSV